jgi:lipooligosaccharide transport system permease protein
MMQNSSFYGLFSALGSMRWLSIWRRNFLVWRKQMAGSLVSHIAEPLIALLAFGYGLGTLVGSVPTPLGTVPYFVFVASGLICMSTMNSASFEALYSAYSRLDHQKTWHGILNAAVTIDDVVLGEILWATFKGTFAASIILIVMLCLLLAGGHAMTWHFVFVVPVLALVALCFSCMGMIFTALAKGYDFFAFYMTLFLTPMMFMAGGFFPREQLPAVARAVTEYLPLTAAVNLVRPLFLGYAPSHIAVYLAVLLITSLVTFGIATHLVRKRFAQ